MYKRIVLIMCVLFMVGCGSKKTSTSKSKVQTTKKGHKPSGTKVKDKGLVSKEAYRAQLQKNEVVRKQEEKKKSKSEVLEATSRLSVTSDMIQDYILEYKDIAKDNMATHGIPASIKLAQGVLESGSGQGTLSRNANNHFGIKCHQGWEGESVRHTDDAPDECFRKYNKPAESYVDHSLFLTGRSRYNSLFSLDKDDYEAWAKGLKRAGYATDPKYADKLISLIERYELYKYDAEVLGKKVSGPRSKARVNEEESQVSSTKSVAVAKQQEKVHIVVKGDTLYGISKKYNLSVSKIQELNSLTGSSLSIGQTLKLN